MAGYDFDFSISLITLAAAIDWLRYFKGISEQHGLDVTYRSLPAGPRKRAIRVVVDGRVGAIQHLDRTLLRDALSYAHAHRTNRALPGRVIMPFLAAHRGGVDRAAQFVLQSARLLQDKNYVTATAPLTASVRLHQISRTRRVRQPAYRGIKTVYEALDGWLEGYTSTEGAAILADQGMESWLKARIGLPSRSRKNMHELLRLAVAQGIVDRRQAHRISLFRKTRNRVQHGGGKLRSGSLLGMVDYYLKVFDQWINPDVELKEKRSFQAIAASALSAGYALRNQSDTRDGGKQ